jgi:hypothetical protein
MGWTSTEVPTFDLLDASEVDPVSERVVIFGGSGLSTYDPVGFASSHPIEDPPFEAGYANNMVYFPPNDRFYYFMRGDPTRVAEIALDREDLSRSTIVMMAHEGPATSNGAWAYDSATEIIGGVEDGQFNAFRPDEGFTSEPIDPTGIATPHFYCLDYDPIDGVFVFLADSRMWAYRPR